MRLAGAGTELTKAEQLLLEFLYQNKGHHFTSKEIRIRTGIREDLIEKIIRNLQRKGFSVASEPGRGVHYFINHTWKGWAVAAGAIVAMGSTVVWAFVSNF